MNSAVLIALLSFVGTLVGTFGGIVTSAKLTNFRIEQLEKKVDMQNTITSKVPVIEEKIKTINRRIAKIEHENVTDFCTAN